MKQENCKREVKMNVELIKFGHVNTLGLREENKDRNLTIY